MFLGTSKLPEQANTGREGRYLDAGKLCTGHELARSNCYLVSARASKTCTRGYFLVTFEKIHIVYGSLPGRGTRETQDMFSSKQIMHDFQAYPSRGRQIGGGSTDRCFCVLYNQVSIPR